MDEVVDRKVLDELLELQDENDPEFFKELITVFQESTEDAILGIQTGIDRADAQAVAALAHKLKGSCLPVGATRMSSICAALEAKAKTGSLEGADSMLEQIRSEFEQVTQFFRDEFGI